MALTKVDHGVPVHEPKVLSPAVAHGGVVVL